MAGINALLAADVTALLVFEGTHTAYEIAEETGFTYRTVMSYINSLRKRKLVRVGAYRRGKNRAPTMPVYEWKPGAEDVPMPKMTAAERSKRYRDKQQRKRMESGKHEIPGRSAILGKRAREDSHTQGDGGQAALDPRPDPQQQSVL